MVEAFTVEDYLDTDKVFSSRWIEARRREMTCCT
jgi:hypothetical protein